MPFKKGQSGSPEKRFTKDYQPIKRNPVKGKKLSTILKEILESNAPASITDNDYINAYIEKHAKGRKLTHKETIVLKLIHNAEALGDMRAIVEILDRTEGKVKEEVENNVTMTTSTIKWGDIEVKV
jgi:hypothetical protein